MRKCPLADADIDAKYALTIQVGEVVVLAIGIRKGDERQSVIVADKEERILD